MPRAFLIAILMLAAYAPAYASDARLMVTEVKDSRTTGEFFNNLQIKLKLTGDDVTGVKGIRTVITRAVDDSGRNLLKDEERTVDFKSLQDTGSGPEVQLTFKNPARKAVVVKEIAGEIQLFMPSRDPNATVVFKNFKQITGSAVSDPALAKAGIRLTVLSKKEYEALAKQKEQETAEEAEKSLGKAVTQALKSMIHMFFQVGENDVILQFVDPGKKFISAEVVDAKGVAIETTSTTSDAELRVLGFAEPLPADASLRVFLKTPKSIEVIPLKLAEIALP